MDLKSEYFLGIIIYYNELSRWTEFTPVFARNFQAPTHYLYKFYKKCMEIKQKCTKVAIGDGNIRKLYSQTLSLLFFLYFSKKSAKMDIC